LKIFAHGRHQIDAELIDMLVQRGVTARRMGDNVAALTIELLTERLKVELIQHACSPALQLLDHCLKILSPLIKETKVKQAEATESDLFNQVAYCLSCAFCTNELPSDILDMCSAFSKTDISKSRNLTNRTRKIPMSDPAVKFSVKKDTFLKEVTTFFNETLTIRKWEVRYHREVELKTKFILNKQKNLSKSTRLVSSLIKKRRLLDQQMRVLALIIRIITIAQKIS